MRSFTPPAENFDPRLAPIGEVAAPGFPRRPDPGTEPVLARLWDETFSEPIRYVEADLEAVAGPSRIAEEFGPANDRWAGAVIADDPGDERFGGPLTAVAGQFTIPTVAFQDPENPVPILLGIWVGLGGWGQADPELIQAGVQVLVVPSPFGIPNVQYAAWVEWAPSIRALIKNFNVNPGDTVTFTVCAPPGSSTGYVAVQNVSTGQATSVGVQAPTGVSARGWSAEWIVEDPVGVLPNFGSVNFSNCVASNGQGEFAPHDYAMTTNITNSQGVPATSTEFAFVSPNDLTVEWLNFGTG